MHRLLHLHLTLGHRSFRSIAAQFNLTVPDDMAPCWACLMAKPRAITHDKVSSRNPTRVYQYIAADATEAAVAEGQMKMKQPMQIFPRRDLSR